MEVQKIVAMMAATAAGLLAQSNWPGIQPGVSTRADVEREAGAAVRTVSQTLVEYQGAQAGDRAFVQYRSNGVVERVEILLARTQERDILLRTLGLGQPEVTRQNSRGQTEELYGSKSIVLTVGSAGVERVAYYSLDLFEAAGGKREATSAQVQPPPPVTLNNRAENSTTSTTATGGTALTIPAATKLAVRLAVPLSTDKNKTGERFAATLDQDLLVDGQFVARKGAAVGGRITSAIKSGRVKGVGELHLELTSLHTDAGGEVAVSTGSFIKTADSSVGSDAKKAGAAAAVGAIVGAVVGGGKGAAIGGGAGAAGAGGLILIQRGKPAELPVETLLEFQISLPVTVPAP